MSSPEVHAINRSLSHLDLDQDPAGAQSIVDRVVINQERAPWEALRRLPGVAQWGSAALQRVMTAPELHPWTEELVGTFDLAQVVDSWRKIRPMPWQAIDRLGSVAPPESRSAWIKRWGHRLPHCVALGRASCAPSPEELRRRARPRA